MEEHHPPPCVSMPPVHYEDKPNHSLSFTLKDSQRLSSVLIYPTALVHGCAYQLNKAIAKTAVAKLNLLYVKEQLKPTEVNFQAKTRGTRSYNCSPCY